jgi:methylmalonyl-CoA/ethylmalonyl-CoA epimerase
MTSFWHHHGALSVPDLAAAKEWYAAILGFTYERGRFVEAIPAEMAMLKNGPLRIELFQPANGVIPSEPRNTPDADIRSFGFKHIAFATADVFALEADLRARGADIIFVAATPTGGTLFIRDPFGNTIEFVQQPAPEIEASACI